MLTLNDFKFSGHQVYMHVSLLDNPCCSPALAYKKACGQKMYKYIQEKKLN